MANDVGADARELARLAQTFLHESQRLGDALRGAQSFSTPPSAHYGSTPGGAALHHANDEVVELAALAVGRLVEVLEGDVDRLYRLAFVYAEAERQAAQPPRPRGGPQP